MNTKPPAQRRKRSFTVWVTPELARQVVLAAIGDKRSISDWIKVAMQKAISVPETRAELDHLYRKIAHRCTDANCPECDEPRIVSRGTIMSNNFRSQTSVRTNDVNKIKSG